MNPTPIGYLAIGIGVLIALAGALAGGNVVIIGPARLREAPPGSDPDLRPPSRRAGLVRRLTLPLFPPAGPERIRALRR